MRAGKPGVTGEIVRDWQFSGDWNTGRDMGNLYRWLCTLFKRSLGAAEFCGHGTRSTNAFRVAWVTLFTRVKVVIFLPPLTAFLSLFPFSLSF